MASEYCDAAYVYLVWGKDNVEGWADLDSTGSQPDIDARILDCIQQASAYIDSRLAEGKYAENIPFSNPAPLIIKRACALKTGIMLHDGRAVTHEDPDDVTRQRRHCNELMRQLFKGQALLLDAGGNELPTTSHHPSVPES